MSQLVFNGRLKLRVSIKICLFFLQMKPNHQLKTMKIARYKLKPSLLSGEKKWHGWFLQQCLVTRFKTAKGVSCCFNTFCTEVKLIKRIFLLALASRWGYKCKTKLVSKYILPEHFSKEYEGIHTLEKQQK